MVLTGPPHPSHPCKDGAHSCREPRSAAGVSASRLVFPQEFEIELEGSQSLRILCYEKCYDKTKVNKDNNEIVDKIMGKGQIQVRGRRSQGTKASVPGRQRQSGRCPSPLPSRSRGLAFVTWVHSYLEQSSPRSFLSPCWRWCPILAPEARVCLVPWASTSGALRSSTLLQGSLEG